MLEFAQQELLQAPREALPTVKRGAESLNEQGTNNPALSRALSSRPITALLLDQYSSKTQDSATVYEAVSYGLGTFTQARLRGQSDQ